MGAFFSFIGQMVFFIFLIFSFRFLLLHSPPQKRNFKIFQPACRQIGFKIPKSLHV